MSDSQPSHASRFRRLLRFSVAGWATIVMGVTLQVVAVTAWIVYSLDPSRVAWGNYMTLNQALGLLLLWALCCFLTYWSVRLWMRQPPIADKALRESWKSGRDWLAHHSYALGELPVFIVLGCWSRHLQTMVLFVEMDF